MQTKLTSKRTRHRTQVGQAVDAIHREGDVEGIAVVEIKEWTTEKYRQECRGRPGPDTQYRRSGATRFDLTRRIDNDRLAEEARCDGMFPLVGNVTTKQQPMIEKRFSQLKTDFVLAPVFLKELSRIQALLCASFFAPLTESLLERERRRAMAREGVESLPLYPDRPISDSMFV